MQIEAKKISLSRQLCLCALMCGVAVVVIVLFHSQPYIPSLIGGLPVFYQIPLGVALGGLFWAASAMGYKYTVSRQSTQYTVESYSRLDLRGWNPLWIALAAGFGEELLFRGALQPLLGIWVTSALFVLVHARAYRFSKFNKRMLVQALCIFATSVFFGFLARYAGLVAAMIVHAAIDVVGLYTIRRVTHAQVPAAA
ncbi:CPBP family intramembrane metalloprotease [Rhodanobacter sp. AS-Z3]|uniref:CPBP family intramembrane glutamic endopeptidase n=1 Tax=Rhodanobacter sp. AS-Z3 TaxID=3031330 RepID=UPI0024799726|nr:CPBP family intramembrane glutamic endopeptidase [Rhodanobacter sp. AS-Z3]WEN15450.1 CPBP family intramembrane metalloprotease [Rhodanobacter sp. AS-Z3]